MSFKTETRRFLSSAKRFGNGKLIVKRWEALIALVVTLALGGWLL